MEIENFNNFRHLNIETIKGLCNVIGLQYEYLKGKNAEMKKMTLFNIIRSSYREEAISFLNDTTVGISYSSVNKDVMLAICKNLENSNRHIYTDVTNISDTKFIIDAFERKLAQQDVFLVLISTDYLKSEHCMYELYYNYVYNKQSIEGIVNRTIPLWIKGTDLGDDAVLKLQKVWKEKKNDLNNLFNELYDVNKQALGERIGRVDSIYFHFTEIVSTLKNISMVIVDPDNIQESIPNLLQRIDNITLQWE